MRALKTLQRVLDALEDGPPGWFWASGLTATVIVSWFLAGADVKKYLELWKACGVELLTFSGSVIATWLAYKGVKSATSRNVSSPGAAADVRAADRDGGPGSGGA